MVDLVYTIEREDSDQNYCPDNCSWATRTEQARNTRSNRIVFFRGKEMCLAEAAELAGVKYGTARYRLEHGYPIDWCGK